LITSELLAIVLYLLVVGGIGYISYRRNLTSQDFIIGSRSLNYWLTALAAHASDMSSWLFLAYPALIFNKGLIGMWIAIGLVVFMYLNWQLVAPRIRVATEEHQSLTFSSFFESRLGDTTGLIRLFSALILIVFYTIYISSGLMGMGDLLGTLFNMPYPIAIIIGIVIIIPYVFFGGYRTLAWIDLFQGCFLLAVIIFVPLFLLKGVGGFSAISDSIKAHNLADSLIPNFSKTTIVYIISTTLGWGLGYFGQPHIITKFMGIKNVSKIHLSKRVGMSWMILSLGGATLVGAVGIPLFNGYLQNPEKVFIEMVRNSFHPFTVGFILCAVIAAMINAMSSQVLVLASSLTEDFYKRLIRPKASSKELLLISRVGVILAALIAYVIAYNRTTTIYNLVNYAWSGIGSSFGPLVLLSLYSKKVNKYGAWAGILGGGVTSGIWPFFNTLISPMIPGFIVSTVLILLVSRFTGVKAHKIPPKISRGERMNKLPGKDLP
jgi:sodium/proline symporter